MRTNGIHGCTSHGLTTLKKPMRVLGGRAIDRRTALGRALEDWRNGLLNHLGGIGQTSTQQRQVVDLAVKTKLILDSIDAHLVTRPSVVNQPKRTVLPVVIQPQQLADALARYMMDLGLERRARPVPTLNDYLAGKRDDPTEPNHAQARIEPGKASASGTTETTETTTHGLRDRQESARWSHHIEIEALRDRQLFGGRPIFQRASKWSAWTGLL